ncbi:hypothetical protein EX30DRAFT_131921 [Ascodesmis nigricans]|uniref:Uncharacterized protein n=1 Tax=Ascodesmis nigricans TaxID=341454 RepID=A0A4S2MNI9_9PEZI|nr:hypothetical protein EX30DRAFT_131921 [Ascodesmis nigricans]
MVSSISVVSAHPAPAALFSGIVGIVGIDAAQSPFKPLIGGSGILQETREETRRRASSVLACQRERKTFRLRCRWLHSPTRTSTHLMDDLYPSGSGVTSGQGSSSRNFATHCHFLPPWRGAESGNPACCRCP